MLASACFLVLLVICTGPQDAASKAPKGSVDRKAFVNLAGTLKKLDTVVGGLERQHATYQQAWSKLKAMEAGVTTQEHTMKRIRNSLGTLRPQVVTLGASIDNLNVSLTREKESLDRLDEEVNDGLRETKEDLGTDARNVEEQLGEINQGIDDQKRRFPQLLRQEAERQSEVRDDFRHQLGGYQDARQETQTEIEGLIETVNSLVADLRSKDEALDGRVAALQTRVRAMTQDVAGLGEQLSGLRLQLETQETTLSVEGENLVTAGNTLENQVQQFGQIQDLLETIQATVEALNVRKRQLQDQTANINTEIQDQQSRLDNHDQQQHSIVQQVEDLGDNYEQQSNAKDLRLGDVEAALDALSADTEVADLVTDVESTVQDLQANMTRVNSKVEQNENLNRDITQPLLRQGAPLEGANNALQEHMQALEAFDEHIQSYGTSYQEQMSTEEARIETIETQVNTFDSGLSALLDALQNTVDGLTTNVEGAEEQFSQYTSPSAILEGLAAVEQSIEDVESTQTVLAAVQQQLAGSRSATNERFGEMETAIQSKQEAMQQAQSDLQAAAQSLETAAVVSDSIAGINARVTANTQGCSALSSSVQQVDSQAIETQQAALLQQLTAIPEEEVQQGLTAAQGQGLQQMTLKLNNMRSSVESLRAAAMAIATSSNSTVESLQDDFDTLSTDLSDHQNAIAALQSDENDGLADTVRALQQTVSGLTGSLNSHTSSLSSIERIIQRSTSAFDYSEKGSYVLPLRRNFWGTTQPYGSPQTRNVNFNRRFRTNPVVFAGITKIDLGSNRNNRLKLIVDRITPSGFRLTFGSWGDTINYQCTAHWIALGKKN
ncbi:uncharacterized protein LOC144907498 [Branchiostoma floridae x Branchiostoma belcheri]